MPILLEIAPQTATGGEPRIASVSKCAGNGCLELEAHDGKIPTFFTLGPGDAFPWESFYQKLRFAWSRSANQDIPREFRLRQPVSEELLAAIGTHKGEELKTLLAAMRRAGYFGKLPKEL